MSVKRITFFAFAMIAMAGCRTGGNNPIVYDDVPTSVAKSVAFVDNVPGAKIGGLITIERPDNETDIAYYILRWGLDGVPAGVDNRLENGRPNFITTVERIPRNAGGADFYSIIHYLREKTVPDGVNSIVAIAANPVGSAEVSASVDIINVDSPNPQIPNQHPQNIQFNDQDNSLRIEGDITFEPPATGEDDIQGYYISYTDQTGCPISYGSDYLNTITKNRIRDGLYDVPLRVRRPLVKTTERLLVIPYNAHGPAYESDCSRYSGFEPFNNIDKHGMGLYAAKRISFSEDQNDAAGYRGTLTIQPAEDERDFTNYNVSFIGPNDECGALVADVEAIGDVIEVSFNIGSLPNRRIGVSSGNCNSNLNKYERPIVIEKIPNNLGNWSRIKNLQTSLCIHASSSTELTQQPCDRYAIEQRFEVIGITHERDGMGVMRSLKYNNHMYRGDDGDRKLGDGYKNDSEDSAYHFEIRGEFRGDIFYSKIANVRKIAGITGFSCASGHGGEKVVGGWANCDWVFNWKDSDIFWQFISPADDYSDVE